MDNIFDKIEFVKVDRPNQTAEYVPYTQIGPDMDFSGCYLMYQDLESKNLSGCNFERARLTGSRLRNANLSGANLRNADLSSADLRNANFMGADMTGCNLRGAILSHAVFDGANMKNVDINISYYENADFRGATNLGFVPMACPRTGEFIGYKRAELPVSRETVIVKLLIPEDATRSSATSRKCRASKAKVLSIRGIGLHEYAEYDTAVSEFDENFIYSVGKIVEVPNFFTDRFTECAPGIHFFIDEEEAKRYGI